MIMRMFMLVALLGNLLSIANAQQTDPAEIMQRPMGFLYLERHRIRYEVLVPLRLLPALYPVMPEDKHDWDPEFQDQNRQAIGSVLQSHMQLAVNGVNGAPLHSAVVFVDLRSPMEADPTGSRTIHRDTGAVGMILQYPAAAGMSYQVDAEWDGFTPLLPELPVRVFSETESSIRMLTPRQNRLLAHYRHPEIGSSSHGESEQPDPVIDDNRAAAAVLERILTNVYGSFEYARDEDIYDALARTVTGDLLPSVYLDIRGSLAMEQEGGAVARVDGVRVTSARVLDSGATTTSLLATWRITGTVEHWGHVHQRTNEYSARIGLERREDRYHMNSLTIHRHDRVGDEYRLRDERE